MSHHPTDSNAASILFVQQWNISLQYITDHRLEASALASLSQDSAVELVRRITEEDLTTEGEPSHGYWKALAERRRLALDESLKENEELHEKVNDLEGKLNISRAMLDESRNLVEVLTEIIQEKDDESSDDATCENNETNNDISSAEEAEELNQTDRDDVVKVEPSADDAGQPTE